MTLTNERAEVLSNYLHADVERAKLLLTLEPDKAVEKINQDGYDFTCEEINDFGEVIRTVASEEEFDEETLDSVSGGSITLGALVGAAFAVKVAYDVGRIIGKNAPW